MPTAQNRNAMATQGVRMRGWGLLIHVRRHSSEARIPRFFDLSSPSSHFIHFFTNATCSETDDKPWFLQTPKVLRYLFLTISLTSSIARTRRLIIIKSSALPALAGRPGSPSRFIHGVHSPAIRPAGRVRRNKGVRTLCTH